MSKHGSCNFRIGSKSFRTARKRLHMPDCACQSTLECVANKRFVGTSLPLTDQTLRICSSGRTWSKKAIRCSSASERPHVKARSAAGPISRSRSGGMADLVGHRGRNGEEEASQGAGSPLNEGLGRALRWDLRERWLTVLSAQNAHSVRPSRCRWVGARTCDLCALFAVARAAQGHGAQERRVLTPLRVSQITSRRFVF